MLLRKALTYVENYLSTASGEGNQLNIVSEVIAGANSNITYGSVDYLDKGFTGHIIRRGTTAQMHQLGIRSNE